MDASEIITRLGGPAELAKRLGAGRTAIYNWRHHGIPARYWLDVHQIAQERGEDIPLDAIRRRPALAAGGDAA